jgi:hypothetical protein
MAIFLKFKMQLMRLFMGILCLWLLGFMWRKLS